MSSDPLQFHRRSRPNPIVFAAIRHPTLRISSDLLSERGNYERAAQTIQLGKLCEGGLKLVPVRGKDRGSHVANRVSQVYLTRDNLTTRLSARGGCHFQVQVCSLQWMTAEGLAMKTAASQLQRIVLFATTSGALSMMR